MDLVRRRSRRLNGLAAISRVQQRDDGVHHAELVDVVEMWVDAALELQPRDLALMRRLAHLQTAAPGVPGVDPAMLPVAG